MDYRIIIDSCGELPEKLKKDERFQSIPFTMTVDGVDIIDDETFDQADFLKRVAEYPESPKSACPSPDHFLKACEKVDAEHIYIVTISSNLSGSFNSAMLAMNMYLDEHSGKKVHVFDSCSASIGETLIAMKLVECEEAGLPFEDIIPIVDQYIESQQTYFVLENLDTLRKNGRLTGVKALVATALKIKPIMGSTQEGTIIQMGQARGINKALVKMTEMIKEKVGDQKNLVLAISHCNCPKRAEMIKQELEKELDLKEIVILETAGLSSMYANDGGIIIVV